ncbi:MAG: TetR/AcrR family transcriptional regulator [Planctomycetota bacterium]|nr:TetR/AcrR family transcriptional regulator [Planctomycetota bacterium]
MASPDRKTEIRARAAQVFADKGFHRASIRDVAKATGMSLAGLYYYYRGKDEILFDIQHEAFSTLMDSHAEALAGVKDPEEKLERVIQAHLTFFADNLPQMKVMSRESEGLEDEFGAPVRELRRRYVRLVRGILDELGADHPLHEVRTGVAVFLLFGMMNWMYTWYDAERDGTAEDLAQAVKTIFLRGLLKR